MKQFLTLIFIYLFCQTICKQAQCEDPNCLVCSMERGCTMCDFTTDIEYILTDSAKGPISCVEKKTGTNFENCLIANDNLKDCLICDLDYENDGEGGCIIPGQQFQYQYQMQQQTPQQQYQVTQQAPQQQYQMQQKQQQQQINLENLQQKQKQIQDTLNDMKGMVELAVNGTMQQFQQEISNNCPDYDEIAETMDRVRGKLENLQHIINKK